MEQVRKRNNKVVPYNPRKIYLCIRKANADCKDARMPRADILAIIKQIETTLGKYKAPSVETIQDEVEKALMRNGWEDTAKAYIIYRNEHAKVRDTHESLMKQMMEIVGTKSDDADFKRLNANIPSDLPMGIMLLFGVSVSNYYVDNYVLPKKYVEAHRNGWIHIHDKDFLLLTSNCLQTDVLKCFKGGFHVGGYYIREPKSVRSAGSLVCIILQTQQNALFGGESIQNYDRGMALGIRCTFKKEFLNAMRDYLSYECDNEKVVNSVMAEVERQDLPTYQRPKELLTTKMEPDVFHKVLKKAYEAACQRTENESYQAAESVIHNLNTMHSRAGKMVARRYRNVS